VHHSAQDDSFGKKSTRPPHHTPLDLVARCDDGRDGRPWLTVITDDYSRAIAGFSFSFDAPSSIRTALALRQAIWGDLKKRIFTYV